MNARIDTEIPYRGWLTAAVLLLLATLVLPAPAAAAEPVGRAISSIGEVTAFRTGESARSLNRGDPVYEGDEIRTGANGRAQIRFIDQGLTNLSPSTTMAVDEYRIEDDGADGGSSAVLSFLRGAMRTITGFIGDNDEDTYRMNTPTATIGVRGTGYALQYCDAACAQEFGGEPGLYGRVDDGAIRVDTPRGSIEFGSGSYFFVPDGGVPRGILQPPAGVLDGEEDEGNGDGGDTGEGVAIIPVDEQEGDDILLTGGDADETDFEAGDEFQGITGIVGASVAAAGQDAQMVGGFHGRGLFGSGEDQSYSTNSSDQVVAANFESGTVGSIQLDNAQLAESGSINELNVAWGRWNGNFIIDKSSGYTGNMAFTFTDNLTEPTALSGLSGSLSYALAGGPDAFDWDQNIWLVDTFSLNVDFDAGTNPITLNSLVLLSTTRSFSDVTYGSANTGSSTLDLANNTLILNLNDGFSNTSKIEGQFVGSSAEGMITTFHIDVSDTQITGTSVLER